MTAPEETQAKMDAIHREVKTMLHSPIKNYVLPGLTSWLVGGTKTKGTVRLFHSAREQHEFVVPHSHRFDFTCLVLSGHVTNTIFHKVPLERVSEMDEASRRKLEVWALGRITAPETPGEYPEVYRPDGKASNGYYNLRHCFFRSGDVYSMLSNEIHSITFSDDCSVLFFEGPPTASLSVFLEPVVDGERVQTFKTQDWMFQRKTPVEPF